MMKLKKKASICLKLISGKSSISSMSKKTGMTEEDLSMLVDEFTAKAHYAFYPSTLEIAVSALASSKPLSIVQVGANDGKSGDPIYNLVHQHASHALFIEPQTEQAQLIEQFYSEFSGALSIERIAISKVAGTIELFRLKHEYYEEYFRHSDLHPSQLTSSNRDYVVGKICQKMKLETPVASQMVESVTYPCDTLEDVLKRHGIDRVDLLQVDCEGYDFKVVETLGEYRPSIINIESAHLSADDRASWKAWTSQNNYGVLEGRRDSLAILGSTFNREWI